MAEPITKLVTAQIAALGIRTADPAVIEILTSQVSAEVQAKTEGLHTKAVAKIVTTRNVLAAYRGAMEKGKSDKKTATSAG